MSIPWLRIVHLQKKQTSCVLDYISVRREIGDFSLFDWHGDSLTDGDVASLCACLFFDSAC